MGIKIKKSRSTPTKITTAKVTAAPTDLGNKKLEGVVVEMRKLVGDGEHHSAEVHYALGRKVREVKEDLTGHGLKRGANAVKLLSEKTGYKKDTLYNAANVAERWSQPEFERWLKKKTEKGNPITFAIFVEVAKLENPKAREAMLEDVREKDLTSRQVRAAVSGERQTHKPAKPQHQKPQGGSLDQVVTASEIAFDAGMKLSTSIKQLGDQKGAEAVKAADRAAELQDALAAVCLANAKALREFREAMEGAVSAPTILNASNPVPLVQTLEAAGIGEVIEHAAAVSAAAPLHDGHEEEGPEEGDDDELGEEDEEGDGEEERDPNDVFEEMKRRHEDRRDEADEEEDNAPQSLNDALRDF